MLEAKHLQCIGKSLLWNIANLTISFMQIILIFLGIRVFRRTYDFSKLFTDGAILFFAATLISTIVLEYYFLRKRLPKAIEGFALNFIPGIYILFTAFIYGGSAVFNIPVENTVLIQLSIIAISFAVFYSLIMKSVFFWKK